MATSGAVSTRSFHALFVEKGKAPFRLASIPVLGKVIPHPFWARLDVLRKVVILSRTITERCALLKTMYFVENDVFWVLRMVNEIMDSVAKI